MMSPEEFNDVLSVATPDQLRDLEQAHWRYMTLIGEAEGVVDQAIADEDRAAFPNFASAPGCKRIFSEDNCSVFMVSITGQEARMCDAWADQEFFTLHGQSTYFPTTALPL